MAEQKPFQIKRKKDQTFPTNHPYNIWRLYTFYIYKAVLITSRQYRTFCVSWNISTCLNMIKYSMCQNNFKTRFTQFLLNWYSFHIIHVMSETTKSDRNRGSRLFEKVCERNILQERMLCNWHVTLKAYVRSHQHILLHMNPYPEMAYEAALPDIVTSTLSPSRTSICWKRLRLMSG